jgi:predicted transcriptional regulator
MREAVSSQPGGVEVCDEQTQRVYVLVEGELHRRALDALRQQEDIAAIQDGIDDMEAGRVVPLEEADRLLRDELRLPPASGS